MPNALETRVVAKMFARDPSRRLVKFGTATTFGLFRNAQTTTDDGNGALIRNNETIITLPTGALALVEGSTVSVYATKDATSTPTSYTVRDTLLIEDGLQTRYLLAAA